MSETDPGVHECESHARVCVGCLHLEGLSKSVKGGKECVSKKMDLGTRLRMSKINVQVKKENVQMIMSDDVSELAESDGSKERG